MKCKRKQLILIYNIHYKKQQLDITSITLAPDISNQFQDLPYANITAILGS